MIKTVLYDVEGLFFKLQGVVYRVLEDKVPNIGDLVIVNHKETSVFAYDENCAAASDEYDFKCVEVFDCDDPTEY